MIQTKRLSIPVRVLSLVSFTGKSTRGDCVTACVEDSGGCGSVMMSGCTGMVIGEEDAACAEGAFLSSCTIGPDDLSGPKHLFDRDSTRCLGVLKNIVT